MSARLLPSRLLVVLGLLAAAIAGAAEAPPKRFPNILLVSVDTLRYDRMGSSGYHRPLTPHLDELFAGGVRFSEARVPEPLTAPSMASLVTSLHPHEHGASRNGLRMRPELPSLPKILATRGYRTAAFVGNWTLRDELSGLGEHFREYHEVLSRKRWLLFLGEATAEDLTGDALDWIDDHLDRPQQYPFLLWVHYVEPHAPYRLHDDLADELGISRRGGEVSAQDRYDTEVAYVDRAIGRLLAGVAERSRAVDTMVIFLSDHGESLGEHGYTGHGRHLYDVTLKVPMAITWPGRLETATVDRPASSLDLAPTVLGLLGLPVPEHFQGFDWAPVLGDGDAPPAGRLTYHQAHKGAVRQSSNKARRRGLLEVAWVGNGTKEVWRTKGDGRKRFDLVEDPGENRDLAPPGSSISDGLIAWLERVREGLRLSDELPPPSLDEESRERLRALGYLD